MTRKTRAELARLIQSSNYAERKRARRRFGASLGGLRRTVNGLYPALPKPLRAPRIPRRVNGAPANPNSRRILRAEEV